MLYKQQAKYQEAEELLLETVEGCRLKLGDTHPHTLESWNSLGDITCEDIPDSPLKNGRLNNVLIGQVVALTLNLRIPGVLLASSGELPLSGEFSIPVEEDSTQRFPIPQSILDILGQEGTVDDLLILADIVLADGADEVMEDINDVVTSVNKAFHQWRTMTELAVEDDSLTPE